MTPHLPAVADRDEMVRVPWIRERIAPELYGFAQTTEPPQLWEIVLQAEGMTAAPVAALTAPLSWVPPLDLARVRAGTPAAWRPIVNLALAI